MRSLFRVTCRKVLLACTMNRAQILLRSLKLRLRATLGMVRARRWSYLQRPRPWLEFHHCFGAGGGAGGAVGSSAGRASMARNGQVPRRSGSAIGVAIEVILRETAWRHSQWHQVGSRGNLVQRASSALRTRATTGVIVVLEGGDLPRVADLHGPLLPSTRRTIPGPPDRGRVERLHNGLYRCCLLYTSPSPRD